MMKTECQFNNELYKIIGMFSMAKFMHVKIDRFYDAIICYVGGGLTDKFV